MVKSIFLAAAFAVTAAVAAIAANAAPGAVSISECVCVAFFTFYIHILTSVN